MLKIEPKKGILDIALYQAGSAPRPADQNVIKLSSNENPYGPSKKSIDAITRHAAGYIFILQLAIWSYVNQLLRDLGLVMKILSVGSVVMK